MKRLLSTLIVFCFAASVFSQTDPSLQGRLNNFMELNKKLDFEKIMDYTYPKVFTFAPRDQMIAVMKKSFDNEQMTLGMDSLKTDSIYPVFKMQEGSYAKIKYSMLMRIQLKNEGKSEDEKKTINEGMLAGAKSQYGGKARMDSSGTVTINMDAVMVAIKDKSSKDWTFANLKEGDEMTTKIFSKELLDKLATYK